jgi:hypothetical protein
MKGKYIKTIDREILLFPEIVQHKDLKSLNPISAGFFHISSDYEVQCYGESISLGLKSDEEDTIIAKRQFNTF